MNNVLKNCGEATISATSGTLSTVQQVIFDNLNKVLQKLAIDTNFKPLETAGTLTLATNTLTYSAPSDFHSMAKDSIQNPNSDRPVENIAYLTPDEFDTYFPVVEIGTASQPLRQGYPSALTYYQGQFKLDRFPTSNENTKLINFRYFKTPTLYVAGTDSGTSWIPEPFDATLLCNYATWLTMEYLDHPKKDFYRLLVFGDPLNRTPEGELSTFKRAWGAPECKPRMTYVFSKSRS